METGYRWVCYRKTGGVAFGDEGNEKIGQTCPVSEERAVLLLLMLAVSRAVFEKSLKH